MPIYEFYCARCHKIFKFLSRRPDREARPSCPGCGRPELERRFSLFAVSRGLAEKAPDDTGAEPDVDEGRLEQAMAALEHEADGIDGDDPRQAARLLRKLYDASGLGLGPSLEEAIRRMEAGEDPDTVEEELGDALEKEDPFSGGSPDVRAIRRRLRPPEVDETLHDL